MNLIVLVPGSLATLTGGYEYDRRIVAALRDRGWSIDVRELDESFPHPTEAARQHAARVLSQIRDESTVVIDGLALGAMPDEATREARRLRLVAIVHHPLADETGIDPRVATELAASERRALTAVGKVIVTSEATARRLKNYGVGRERISVVEPGTDPAPLARGSRDGGLQLLCVATLVPRKGHELLIDALARIRDRRWRLTCIGSLTRETATVERVKARLHAHALDDRVDLAGEMDPSSLTAYYDAADVFVLPTFYEGYGMAVANALAHGLPVISTATGAIGELVGTDPTCAAGILVPAGDLDALTDALTLFVDDATIRRRSATAARQIRQRLPTWDDAAGKMADALG